MHDTQPPDSDTNEAAQRLSGSNVSVHTAARHAIARQRHEEQCSNGGDVGSSTLLHATA